MINPMGLRNLGFATLALCTVSSLTSCSEEKEGRPVATVPDGGDGGCVRSCAELGADCGEVLDDCGKVVQCGSCPQGQTCGAAGANRCGAGACFPTTCSQLGVECGLWNDGCETVLDCGTCPEGTACGAAQAGTCSPEPDGPDADIADVVDVGDSHDAPYPDADIPSCSDGIKNQDETDVDCGGSCALCGDGRACLTSSECASGWCDATQSKVCCTPGVGGCAQTSVQPWTTPWPTPVGNYYRYAPTAIEENGSRYYFWCGNWTSGDVTDHIVMRVDQWSGSGWTVGAEKVALAPGASGAWDDRHVCDPDVVQGEFRYTAPGETVPTTYSYALFYLGVDDEQQNGGVNRVGWAVAKSLEGPWRRVTVSGPLVNASEWWGVGQPAVTSIDGKGEVMLFYTRGDSQGTRTMRRSATLLDANAPVLQAEMEVPVSGLQQLDGSPDPYNHGGAFVFDSARDLFWIVRGVHPFPQSCPDFISTELEVASIPGASMWSGTGTWTVHVHLTSALMGSGRAFDGGFVRTAYGTLLSPERIDPVVSVASACTGNVFSTSLWTYRTHDVSVTLQ
jgi:hypothetical protein